MSYLLIMAGNVIYLQDIDVDLLFQFLVFLLNNNSKPCIADSFSL